MQTQSTTIHIRLWHRDFWLMVVANMLLSASAYMMLPVLPGWLMATGRPTAGQVGVAMGAFGLGLYALGPFCSYLVQRYRRNVVCMVSVLGAAACLLLMGYSHATGAWQGRADVFAAMRLAFGACFGLAQMVLSSTLIIDTSESFQRTEANHISAWFYRFGISLGPMCGLMANQWLGFGAVVTAAVACALLAVVLVRMVRFPFRTPEEGVRVASLDRFFLPKAWPLFINLVLVTMVVGLAFCMASTPVYYGMMMVGFLLSLLSQRFVFRNAEIKSEVVTGIILIMASLWVWWAGASPTAACAAPLLMGCGMGITGARFLLFFIKLSRHCQRGTSQSTYMLGWETGVALGLLVGHTALAAHGHAAIALAMALSAVALAMYVLFTHRWYMAHKNR